MSGDVDDVDPPLNHHYPFKGQQSYNIINVCVFVNTNQKELEMDMQMIWSRTPLSTTTP